MAVVHEERRGGRLYQVRSAGSSLRLYTNGVLHSQLSRSPRATASIWELLSMSALLFEPERVDNVLLLGVGGGGVVHLLKRWFGAVRITGIELDPVHVELGRRYFGLDLPGVEVIAADARRWLADHSDRHFDLVIDDLFADAGGEARRAVDCDGAWLDALGGMLEPHGVLAINFADLGEFRRSAAAGAVRDDTRFRAGHSLRIDTLDNVVAVLTRRPSSLARFEAAIAGRFGARTANRCGVRNLPNGAPSRSRRKPGR